MTYDRNSKHPKFDPTGVRTDNLQIMTVYFINKVSISREFSGLYNLHPLYWNTLFYSLWIHIFSGKNSAHFSAAKADYYNSAFFDLCFIDLWKCDVVIRGDITPMTVIVVTWNVLSDIHLDLFSSHIYIFMWVLHGVHKTCFLAIYVKPFPRVNRYYITCTLCGGFYMT